MTTQETKPDEELSPEVGGTIYVDDYNGNEVAIEGAQSPFVANGTPVCHSNGNEVLEY